MVERLAQIYPEDKHRIITITGVSGAGKNYLVDKARETDPGLIGGRIAVFNFGSELLQSIVSDLPELEHQGRDKLKNLPMKVVDGYIERTIQKLIRVQPAMQLTHLVFRQEGELVIKPESERLTNAIEYIFVEADPAMVNAWRMKEYGERARTIETVDEIRLHQEIAKSVTLSFAKHFGAGMLLIYNHPVGFDDGVAAMLEEARMLLR